MPHRKAAARPAEHSAGTMVLEPVRRFVLEVGGVDVGVLTRHRGGYVFHTARTDLTSLQGQSFRSMGGAERAVRQKLDKVRGTHPAARPVRQARG